MIKCPVCHSQNYSLEGANTKLFSLSKFQKLKSELSCTQQTKYKLHLKLCMLKKKTYFFSIPVQYFSLDKLFVLRDCDTLKTFHFGWRTFTNGSGGVRRFSCRGSAVQYCMPGSFWSVVFVCPMLWCRWLAKMDEWIIKRYVRSVFSEGHIHSSAEELIIHFSLFTA